MKSSLAKIMFRIIPLTTIATAIVHPSSGVILASLLIVSIPLILCWGFDENIARFETKDAQRSSSNDNKGKASAKG